MKVCVDKGDGLEDLPWPHFHGFSEDKAEAIATRLTDNPANDYRYEAVPE